MKLYGIAFIGGAVALPNPNHGRYDPNNLDHHQIITLGKHYVDNIDWIEDTMEEIDPRAPDGKLFKDFHDTVQDGLVTYNKASEVMEKQIDHLENRDQDLEAFLSVGKARKDEVEKRFEAHRQRIIQNIDNLDQKYGPDIEKAVRELKSVEAELEQYQDEAKDSWRRSRRLLRSKEYRGLRRALARKKREKKRVEEKFLAATKAHDDEFARITQAMNEWRVAHADHWDSREQEWHDIRDFNEGEHGRVVKLVGDHVAKLADRASDLEDRLFDESGELYQDIYDIDTDIDAEELTPIMEEVEDDGYDEITGLDP